MRLNLDAAAKTAASTLCLRAWRLRRARACWIFPDGSPDPNPAFDLFDDEKKRLPHFDTGYPRR